MANDLRIRAILSWLDWLSWSRRRLGRSIRPHAVKHSARLLLRKMG